MYHFTYIDRESKTKVSLFNIINKLELIGVDNSLTLKKGSQCHIEPEHCIIYTHLQQFPSYQLGCLSTLSW